MWRAYWLVGSGYAISQMQGEDMIDSKTKRITLKVSKDIDLIRDRLAADTGIEMTYNQIFNFLVHFYVERASEPKSKWKSLS
jgi:hypothetical protein